MSAQNHSDNELRPRELRLDRLLGRRVLAANDRSIGRIEEFHAERRGRGCTITECVIGTSGLWERLGMLGKALLFGPAPHGYVARWDQIDLSDPTRPRLTCALEDLRKI